MSGSNFTFVLSTSKGQVTKSERLRVRSTCMQGKNKRHDSRRSLREAKRAAAAAKKVQDADDRDPATTMIPFTSVPPPANGDPIGFAEDVDRNSREALHRFLMYSRLKHEFYTIDYIVNFDKYMTDHSSWLLHDDAFFHSVIMSTSAMQDFLLGHPLSSITLHHLRRTLTLLNHRLSDGDLYQMDSTIWIILTLAMISGFFCDFAATGTHISGLRQIVHLRGGRRFLEDRPKIQFKLESLEFSSCLSIGGMPRLWGPPVTWDRIFPVTSTASIDIPPSLSTDRRILAVFDDLRELAAMVNRHIARESRLDGGVFQAAMSSIRYRLLFLLEDEDVRGSTCECLCLGMLAFLTTMFAIPGKRLPYPYLAVRVQDANWSQGLAMVPGGSCDLYGWLLLMCAMTVVDVGDGNGEWLRELWAVVSTPGTRWEAFERRMSSIAWLPNVHDAPGREEFDKLNVA